MGLQKAMSRVKENKSYTICYLVFKLIFMLNYSVEKLFSSGKVLILIKLEKISLEFQKWQGSYLLKQPINICQWPISFLENCLKL